MRPKLAAYEVDGKIVYAKDSKGVLKEFDIDPRGIPTATDRNVGWHTGAQAIVWWKREVSKV